MSKFWTEERLAKLNAEYAEGIPLQDIADHLGTSKRTVENRLYWLRMTPERRAARRQKINEYRRALKKEDTRVTIEQVQVSARPSEEQLRQRDAREMLPYRDLTAMLCGDPPIGLSALDQRA
ncbi:hypothetical protein [Afipia sp. DC4300-2b1]|uniref:hypothetical protein n=1 Tax=Afipia sp. DC4300-2b1 TaxID=2804672 RepID=UPI003CE99562